MEQATRVLVAEDESLVAEMIQGILEERGYRVAGTASTGREAVELTQALRPSVVLMDVSMPDMDGIDAARAIASTCPTPVVVLTAYDTPEIIAGASTAGVGAYLTKPPNARDLDRAIIIARARFADLLELRRVNADLRQALLAVKRLSGLLPICSGCKRIRDDRGSWHLVEEYIQSHSEAEFTHGLCPSCSRELYPQYSRPR